MKYSILLIVFSSLIGCAANMPKAGISKKYKHVGALVESPSEPNWYLLKHTDPSVVFAKRHPDKSETAIANTDLIWIGEFNSDKEFFDAIIEARKANDDKYRFKQLEITHTPTTYKGRPCVKYSGVSEDHGSAGINSNQFQYFKNFGYICRTNLNQTTALLMEVSHRSGQNNFPPNLKKVALEFFENIELTKY